MHGLPRQKGACWSPVLPVPGAPVCCRASHQRHVDDESRADPSKNPDFGYLLRGTVHDPTARRMGGVAGHAGVFSTAHDVSIYAQALLDRLADRPSRFPLKQATLELMTTPEQPGHTARQVEAANDAAREAIAKTPNTTDPLLAPNYPAIKGQQPVRLWLGYRYGLFQAARPDLSHRQLWRHRLYRHVGLAGPRLRYLRNSAGELNPSCEAVHRSRSCEVTWLRRQPRPCVSDRRRR